MSLTHVGFVFEGVVARRSSAMEMSGALTIEGAVSRGAILSGPKTLEAFLNDCRVFAMVISMHLNVRCANVHFVAVILLTESLLKSFSHWTDNKLLKRY